MLLLGNNFDPFKNYPVDNYNDTFCNFEGLTLTPAKVINSNKAICKAPPSYVYREAEVELTLNNQQFTDDQELYHYYKPPYVFDIDPPQGPTGGSTEVTLIGTNFEDSKFAQCKFGDVVVPGEYVSSHNVKCVAPPIKDAVKVPLSVAFEEGKWSSGSVDFLYYDQPQVAKIEPTCGPEHGYTQITVFGKNFVDLGVGKVLCAFNRTVFMNATVMEPDIIKCDSPAAHQWFKAQDNAFIHFDVEVTLDGKVFGGPPQTFAYYKETQMTSIVPNMGPKKGGTQVIISGFGFQQAAVCNMTVRFGPIYASPTQVDMHQLKVRTPAVDVADAVVASIGMNGQQFIKDKTLYERDPENTFTFYDDPTVIDFYPVAGLSAGNTKVHINGKGFLPLKNEDGEYVRTPVWVRMIDARTGHTIGEVTEADYVDNENIEWTTPAAPEGTRGVISMSLNNREYLDIHLADKDYSFEYYQSPKITGISP